MVLGLEQAEKHILNKPKRSPSTVAPAQSSTGAASRGKSTAARKRASSSRTKRKNSHKRHRKGSRNPFWRRVPSWALFTGIALVVALYLFLFYYFFVGPFSFRWKAIYGDPDYPEGYEVRGIDISHSQEHIDWERVRNATINGKPLRFAFVKATEGVSIIDENFNDNFYQARQNDIIRGAYHFFAPDVDSREQARFFIKQVHLEAGDLPPVLDVEKKGKLDEQQLKKAVLQWLKIVERHYGVKPIIYTSYKFKLQYLNDQVFNDYPYWIAHYYVGKLEYKGPWSFWQYTDVGHVEGIKGYVDCNTFNGTLQQLHALTINAEEVDLICLQE